jgi:Winged helix DNA-binding domain
MATLRPTETALLAARLRSQLLSGTPAAGPVEVAERLLAIQAQDPRGARLAIRARSRGLTAASVERALSDDRTLVIGWLCRGTLHLVRREDYPWLHALTTPRSPAGRLRRLAQLGVPPADAERGVSTIERSLADRGPLTRRELRSALEEAGVPSGGQAIVHLLGLASDRGLTVRGPLAGSDHAFALVHDWLGPPPPFERDVALAELARRYLAGHAPACDRDLAKWSGLPLRDARRGLAAIAAELHQRADGLLEAGRAGRSPALPGPRLLGPFDPVLHGWTSRELIVGEHVGVVTVNGIFRAIALVGGRAVATWRLRAGRVALAPFDELAAADAAALEADAQDVVRFLSRG